MIIHPKVKGFICTTAHPDGCAANIHSQIKYVKSLPALCNGPKKVLVIGASTGYGLSSRIMASFGGSEAATIGVFFEKPYEGKRTATAGWYNSVAFEKEAQQAGLYAKSFNGDAYSDELKSQVVEAIKKDWGSVDLIVYSLAAPRRQHPKTGEVAKSVLKPIGNDYSGQSLDLSKDVLEDVTLPAATEDDIVQTVAVMGGEDWKFWIDALEKEGLIADGAMTVAYSYMGPEITRAIYRNGTIGRAKDHLEETAKILDVQFKKKNGRAFVSVNKALVTQSSSAIPFIPLYYIILTKVLKEMNLDEDCITQIGRLFLTKLYSSDGTVEVDEDGLVLVDNNELDARVQEEVKKRWKALNPDNLKDVADLNSYHAEFLKLFGFGFEGVDYDADVNPDQLLPSSTMYKTGGSDQILK